MITWKDLKLRVKIGVGFMFMFFIILILGLITYLNLAKVNHEISELSDMHIPVVNEANKLDRYWREVSEYSRSYDFTGNEYFFMKEKKSFDRLMNAYDKLSKLFSDKDKEKVLKKKQVDLASLGDLLNKYRDQNAAFHNSMIKVSDARSSLSELNRELGTLQKRYRYDGNVQGIMAGYFSVYGRVAESDYKQTIYGYDKDLADLDSLKQKVSRAGMSVNVRNAVSASIDSLSSFIALNKTAKGQELKKFELSKKIKWDIRAVSDIGIDQITAMGERTNKTVIEQKELLVVSILIIIVIGIILVLLLSHSISRPLERGIKMAERVAEGDLSVKYEVRGKDEVAQLLNALNKMVDNLRGIVNDISISAAEISSSSEKLNREAIELSEGATEQASSSEEASSSMEEIYANIQQNADNARQTESISENAFKGLKETNELSKVAAKYLEEITSKVSVIGDIAFQTNLLALNAAVEAARAGQEGRGFAVVAAEVRKLAERSQHAAAEINKVSTKTLESSEISVEKLDQMSPEIEKTANLVKEISVASMEQLSGVEQINNALQQLNNVTQRNASNSEEILQAVRALEALSGRLNRAISVFKTGKG
jgi:methyl-accepting chemotaxis protein